jgi:carboxyl-terminal processing protease
VAQACCNAGQSRDAQRQGGACLGFKQYHLGEIIGTQTAGAVLAASAFLMDNGDLLLLAVADVTIDGQRLEGVGVRPTIEVPFDPIYAAGRDPQLDRAVQVLSERIKG